jgi:hypothetical protein
VDFYTIKLLFGALFWFVCIVLESLRLLAYDPVCARPCSYTPPQTMLHAVPLASRGPVDV